MPRASRRLIRMEGTYNLRDLGGYPTAGGKQTVWKKLYRSDDLAYLNIEDLNKLTELGLRTYVDFRIQTERSHAPDRVASSVVHVHNLDIDAASLSRLLSSGGNGYERGMEAMRNLYRGLVTQYAGVYKCFFAIVQDPEAAPLLFHCSAGKDRTGVATALILSALGVDRETIFADYQLSGQCLKGKYVDFEVDDSLAPLFGVDRSYLDAAFKTMDDSFGGMDAYLEKRLDVDIAMMRSMYTE